MLALRHGLAPRPVEAHEVSSFLGNLNFPLPAYHCGMLRGEASIIINRLQRTVRCAARR